MNDDEIRRIAHGLQRDQSYYASLPMPRAGRPPSREPLIRAESLRASLHEAHLVERILRARLQALRAIHGTLPAWTGDVRAYRTETSDTARVTGVAEADWRRSQADLDHWHSALNGPHGWLPSAEEEAPF